MVRTAEEMARQLLTYSEAAGQLGCSVSTLRRRVGTGDLPAFVDGGLRRIRDDDLRRYIAERVRRCSSSQATIATPGRTLPKGARLWD